MKFRKKPVVIEAFQMTKERRASNIDWPVWLHMAWNGERGAVGALYPTEEGTSDGTLSIGTLEGQQLVSWGDFIIRGVQGEIYPCKPSIFDATYEAVLYDASNRESKFDAERFDLTIWDNPEAPNMMPLARRLKENLLFDPSETAIKGFGAIGALYIPFKDENEAGALELFNTIRDLVAKL